ncbi:MAG: hypothetical protein FWB93_01150 [Oscillospiraceae bacterium]|nr:hypothetical protein [Oscillospiraceae bacterium]
MQTNTKTIARIYVFITIGIVFATVATVLNSFLFLFHFDRALLLFEITAYAQAYFMLSGVFLLFCFLLLFVYGKSKNVPEHAPNNILINMLCSFGFLSIFITTILFFIFISIPIGRHEERFSQISLAFALPAGAYFIHHLYSENRKAKNLLGFAAIIWSILILLSTNAYISIPINSPLRVGPIFSFSAILLFFVSDIRMNINRQVNGMLFASGLAVTFFSLSNALPQLFLSVAGQLDLSLTIFYNATEIFIVVYAVSRMFSAVALLKLPPLIEDDFHESDGDFAEWIMSLNNPDNEIFIEENNGIDSERANGNSAEIADALAFLRKHQIQPNVDDIQVDEK